MSDELDDLFGAIDGDENDVQESKQQDPNDDEYGEGDKIKEYDGGQRECEPDTREEETDTKKIYTSVMSAPTASRLRDGIAPKGALERVEEENKQDKDAPREISTGTAHDKTVRSYSSFPKNYQPKTFDKPPKPAKEYQFQLDPFQAQAVEYIDKDESVLVAAHTSAGKTAVAEYAIAKALNNGQRVVYTSPIKV